MQYLNRDELKRLLKAIPDSRDRLMVLVAFWHGLRASEVINLRGKDIRNGHVYVKRKKGSRKTNQIYQSDSDAMLNEKELLTKLEQLVKDDELLFPMSRFQFYRLMRKAAVKAGMGEPGKWVRPHILKHSMGQQLANKGVHVRNIQRWLGHASLNNTAIYIEVSDETAGQAVAEAMGS